jgi:hypothetical protein
VRTPDPAATKSFSRGGGFKGTATNAVYLIRRATELWGPMGEKWGVEVVSEAVLDGAPLLDAKGAAVGFEKVHTIRINLRHPTGTVPGIGQTMLVGKNKNGFFTDEEAPKKSLTDALTKALSWLGFAADIHLGLWDDNKYVNEARKAFADEPKATPGAAPAEPPAPTAMPSDVLADWLGHINESHSTADVKQRLAEGKAVAEECGDTGAYAQMVAAAKARAKEITDTLALGREVESA